MLTRLIEHLCWADDRTASALDTLPALDVDALKCYAHLLGAEAVWLARIDATTDPSVRPDLTLDQYRTLAATNQARLRELVRRLDQNGLAATVRYRNSRGTAFENSVADILHHVVLHGMYHRGQIMLQVRAGGGTPLATDFIAYVREIEDH